jgi:hypothetical protein
LTDFVITNDSDQLAARLEASLEASRAKLNADLETLIKSQASAVLHLPHGSAPATNRSGSFASPAPAAPRSSPGTTLPTNRSGSFRERLRTPLPVDRSR